jgi:hypothetical protein
MSILRLPLTKQWFDMTKSGVKKEDYREITPYWCAQFLLFFGEKKPKVFWAGRLQFFGAADFIESEYISFQSFESNIMNHGYPDFTDYSKILNLEHRGIEIRMGNPEWGAEPNKFYFVIMHGCLLA